MTFTDWVQNTRETFNEEGTWRAVQTSVQELWYGMLRRASFLYPPGTPIWVKDWDILIIADACRPDLMESVVGSENIGRIRSVGSKSPEWMENTFQEKYANEMSRTAYITGNPYSESLPDSGFAVFDELWKSHWEESEVSTMPPRPLTDRTINVWRNKEDHDIEQVIVHYMQPHAPFFGYPGLYDGYTQSFGRDDEVSTSENVWEDLKFGETAKEDIWEAYKHNLEVLFEEINLIQKSCSGRIAVTSDHGNGMGEFGVYGHPRGIPTKSVRQVPWYEMEGEDSREYTPATEFEVEHSSDVEERLLALGYK
jgi:hypothetical protein